MIHNMIKLGLISFMSLCMFDSSAKSEYATEPKHQDSLIYAFMEKYPNKLIIECLQEEKLCLSADDDNMLVMLEISNPQLLLRFFMKGFSIYIDPTGKKKERFEIKLPSAESLNLEKLGISRKENTTPEPDALEEKPNILPLIKPLNEMGMSYTINGKQFTENNTAFKIFLDVDNDKLYYYMLLPIHDFFNVKKLSPTWSVGIYSQEIDMYSDDERQGMMPPPPNGDNGLNPSELTKEISQWINFSFEQLSSLNIN